MPRSPRGWLLGIARNTLANQRRGANRRAALIGRIGSETKALWDAADQPPVMEALSRLSAADQEALLLSAWEGLNSTEAAEVLGCTAVAFRLRLYRARRRFERALETEPSDIPFRGPREELT